MGSGNRRNLVRELEPMNMNRRTLLFSAAAIAVPMAACGQPLPAVKLPPPALDETSPPAGPETLVFAGGCFWGVQAVFQHTKGVTSAISGYCGGAANTAEYEVVGTGRTGHAESVQVTFDPKQVSLGRLLHIFFSVATDPTEVNQQFPDVGTQYRNEIWCPNEGQAAVVRAYIAQLNAAKVFTRPIATKVSPAKPFYKAEDYHQDYLTLHPTQPYIATYDVPKVRSLKTMFPRDYREVPIRVFPA